MFDIETDGLLREVKRVHCLVIQDLDTDQVWSFGPEQIRDGLELLAAASFVSGHNIMEFDLPVLEKVYGFRLPDGVRVFDTLLCSRLIWTDIELDDHPLARQNKLPPKFIGSHSLEAWGHRLGELKWDFHNTTDWSEWSREMQDYCEQDVRVNVKLLARIVNQGYSEEAIGLEHDFAGIIFQMTRHGFGFDTEGATQLYLLLQKRRDEIVSQLQSVFPPKRIEMKTPAYWIGEFYDGYANFPTKTAAKAAGATKIHAGPMKVKEIPFNPNSRVQVAERLMALGWVPDKKTEGGSPAVDESVLENLPYPEAKPLAELFMLQKRIGQLAEGKEAWLKNDRNGRVHHSVITNRAVTGRCGHHSFNIAQVPRVGSPFGAECRDLFRPTKGFVLVGADASGLELRCLAHYLGPYDGGAYAAAVTGPDIHTYNQAAFGLAPGKPGRDCSKTGIYALVYGAGDEKLGASLKELEAKHEAAAQARPITQRALRGWARELGMDVRGSIGPKTAKQILSKIPAHRIANAKRGAYAREKVATGIAGFGDLMAAVAQAAKARGWIRGLDGRRLRVRSAHSALNTLLQSAGALLVKRATVIWNQKLQAAGLVWGKDYALVAHVHDEIQAEARPEVAELVGKTFVEAIKAAGESWKFRCPLSGEYKIGNSWKETH